MLNRLTLSPARLHLFLLPLGERSCRGDRPCLGDGLETSGEGDKNLDSVCSSVTSVVSAGSCSFIEPKEWSRCCTLKKWTCSIQLLYVYKYIIKNTIGYNQI